MQSSCENDEIFCSELENWWIVASQAFAMRQQNTCAKLIQHEFESPHVQIDCESIILCHSTYLVILTQKTTGID